MLDTIQKADAGQRSDSGTVNDLREFIDRCKQVDRWRQIDGADWDIEIAVLSEAAADMVQDPPMLLFDNIKGYPAGYRVVGLPVGGYKRAAVALGLPPDRRKIELVRMASRKVSESTPLPPEYVTWGPVLENSFSGDDVDVFRLPVLRYHEGDGGRYIGTGDLLINQDPQSGYINAGTYRQQVHDRHTLGLWMSPGQHGQTIAKRYWQRGQACPVVCTYGGDPLSFMVAHTKIPWGQSELEMIGGLRGTPLPVIRGPLTGLPIPANAEIAIEGEIPPPDVDSRDEGPFGEWPGYYSGGTLGTGEKQPVIHVKALYHRDNPILMSTPPLWPGASPWVAISLRAGVLWDQLEAAGVQDVMGVYSHQSYLVVVSIRQLFAGHAKQAGMAALGCSAEARNGRYVVVVDEDIDPTDIKEVLWAMETRVDPATDIQIVDGCWGTPLDPRMSPAKREAADYTNSRAIFYAVRPYGWKDKFPKVSRSPRELRDRIVDKFRAQLDLEV